MIWPLNDSLNSVDYPKAPGIGQLQAIGLFLVWHNKDYAKNDTTVTLEPSINPMAGKTMSRENIGDSGNTTGFRTARGRDWPSVRQFNVFVANRVGGLMRVVRWFEMTDIRIVSISIVDSADCAIIRLVLSDPERATEIFEQAHLPFTESDLLVVKLPSESQPLLQICKALLEAEVNIHYAYPLLVGPMGNSALALYVEDHEAAVFTLEKKNFVLYTEKDLDYENDGN